MKVGVHTYSAGNRDGYNIPAPSWDPPLNEPGEERDVIGWAPHSSTEVSGVEPNRIVETDVDLLVPPDFQIASEDVVDLPEGQFQVNGDPRDFGYGPYGYNPGMVIGLKRI